jgi:hypothetical protein
MTAVIRRTSMQDRPQMPAASGEVTSEEEAKDSLGNPGIPALQSSLAEHRIVDVEPRTEGPMAEVPKVGESSAPDSAESGSKGEKEKGELSPEDQQRRAEEKYKTKGLSHGCRQSWDLRLRGEKGPQDQQPVPLGIKRQPNPARGSKGCRPRRPRRVEAQGGDSIHGDCGVHLCILGPTHGLER